MKGFDTMMTEDNKKFFEEISEILLEKLNECEKIPCFTNVKITDVFSITCGDRYNKSGIQFRLSNNPWIDLEVYDDGSWELFNHTEIDNLYYDEKTDCIRHVGTNEIEGQKGNDTMKVKVYVNWDEEKILNAKEYEEEIVESAKDREDDDYELNEFLNDYLEDRVPRSKFAYLFSLSEEEREKILELWKEDCLETVKNNSDDDYEEVEIEL